MRGMALLSFAQTCVTDGFVDERDEGDFAVALASWCARCGIVGDADVRRIRELSAEPNRRKVIAEYIRFAHTTNSTRARADKLASLGVPPTTMTHWARRYCGPGTLARAAPPSTGALIRHYLREHPGATRKELVLHAGVKRSSVPGALDYGLKRGSLRREKSGDGRWRWHACS